MLLSPKKYTSWLLFLAASSLTAQEKQVAFDPVPEFYVSVKESYYAPRTNNYIYGFPNTSIILSFNPKASDSFFGIGYSYTRDGSEFMGVTAYYRFLSHYGASRHNFSFNLGYKYLFTQYREIDGNFYYDHELIFNMAYMGVGYQYFFGKEQRFFIAPMVQVTMNFITDDISTNSGMSNYHPTGFYKGKVEGLLAPMVELELGLKLNRKRN